MLVDHRERGSAIQEALVAAGLEVELTDLPVGDYVLGPALAVERKGPHDLGASIRDGRIFDQAVRLQSAFAQAVLLMEGEPRGITEDAWRGAVCRLVEDGFSVLHSLDAEDSAAWIIRLAKRARRAAPTARVEGPRRSPRHPSAQAEAMLSVVPGISTTMSRSLLAAYGSVAAIAEAAPQGLRGHPGIGRVRAARLAEALHGGYVAPGDREPEPGDPPVPRDRRAAGSSALRTGERSPSPSTAARSPCRPCARPPSAPGWSMASPVRCWKQMPARRARGGGGSGQASTSLTDSQLPGA